MLKWPGFSLIEIMTTITILAIVATIAAPEYWRLRDRDAYWAEGQAFFDTILDARNAALTNRICNDDATSVRWMFVMNSGVTPTNYELRCYRDASNYTVEQANVSFERSDLELIDLNETLAPVPMDGSVGNAFPDDVSISFFSGGVQARLEYDDGTPTKADSIQLIIGHLQSDLQQTVCFNRVAGFPTFNKRGSTCQDY